MSAFVSVPFSVQKDSAGLRVDQYLAKRLARYSRGGRSAVAGDGSATVTWDAPADNGAAISAYTVTHIPGHGSDLVPGSQRSLHLSSLTNGTPYTFTVHATNSAGDGPESAGV